MTEREDPWKIGVWEPFAGGIPALVVSDRAIDRLISSLPSHLRPRLGHHLPAVFRPTCPCMMPWQIGPHSTWDPSNGLGLQRCHALAYQFPSFIPPGWTVERPE